MDQDLTDLLALASDEKVGREAALQSIYNRNARRYLAFLRNKGASLSDAEDILQEFLSKLWKTQADLAAVENGGAYLWRMLRTTSIDYFRRNNKLSLVQGAEANDALDEALRKKGLEKSSEELSDIEQHDLSQCLDRALTAFEQDCPERSDAISLIVVEGWNQKQLAEYLGRTYGATREYFSQSCKRFREYFQRICPEFEEVVRG
ncbi:MAG: RNA polymerase sigma factor [Pseudomonadota bacterium]